MPTGSSGDRALGDHRLLAVGLPHRLLVEVEAPGEAAQDLGDLLLHLLVEDQLAAGEAGDDLGGQVVGGRAEPARGDDQVHPLAGQEAQRRLEVLGAVADDEDVGDLDPELGQPFGDPGPVAVGDPPGQHLGAGDDDPGADRRPSLMRRSAFRASVERASARRRGSIAVADRAGARRISAVLAVDEHRRPRRCRRRP